MRVPFGSRAREDANARALTSVLSLLSYGAALVDRYDCYLWVNATGERLLGAPVADLVGRPRRWRETRAPVSLGGELSYCVTRSDGAVREFHADVQEASFEGGSCRLVLFRDVTERHLAARRVLAMARIAAAASYGRPLRQTLDTIAAEVSAAADLL
ncbi:MAG: hypothetical protein M3P48_04210, partial [Actinomycetota bacterium]|nr:hypothetical protein [Actinomycetota bacterium]